MEKNFLAPSYSDPDDIFYGPHNEGVHSHEVHLSCVLIVVWSGNDYFEANNHEPKSLAEWGDLHNLVHEHIVKPCRQFAKVIVLGVGSSSLWNLDPTFDDWPANTSLETYYSHTFNSIINLIRLIPSQHKPVP